MWAGKINIIMQASYLFYEVCKGGESLHLLRGVGLFVFPIKSKSKKAQEICSNFRWTALLRSLKTSQKYISISD